MASKAAAAAATTIASKFTTHISTRAAQNLTTNKLSEIRSHCFHNQYDPVTNPKGIIALAIAENKLMRDEITQHVNQNFRIDPWHLTYGHGPQGAAPLRSELARYVNQTFKPVDEVEPRHICLCNGAGTAVSMLGFCVGEPGEGILVGRPLYVGFFPDIEASSKIKPVLVSMGQTDPTSLSAVQHYEEALHEAESRGTKIRAILLSSPHNPLGRPYTTDALVGYMKLCQKHQIHLISDEVYARSFFPSHHFSVVPPFQFLLSIPNFDQHINPSLVHVIYGMSKDFCANGIRIGCLISPYNASLLRAFRSIASFSRPSQLAEHVWLNLLRDTVWLDDHYFPEFTRRMTEAYEYTTRVFDTHEIPYEKACVSSFIWFDLRRYLDLERHRTGSEAELTLNWRMVREAGVWIAMGESFGAEESGFFRITFASPKDELHSGLERLMNLLKVIEKEKREKGTWMD